MQFEFLLGKFSSHFAFLARIILSRFWNKWSAEFPLPPANAARFVQKKTNYKLFK